MPEVRLFLELFRNPLTLDLRYDLAEAVQRLGGRRGVVQDPALPLTAVGPWLKPNSEGATAFRKRSETVSPASTFRGWLRNWRMLTHRDASPGSRSSSCESKGVAATVPAAYESAHGIDGTAAASIDWPRLAAGMLGFACRLVNWLPVPIRRSHDNLPAEYGRQSVSALNPEVSQLA
jgi:hypothetical protein